MSQAPPPPTPPERPPESPTNITQQNPAASGDALAGGDSVPPVRPTGNDPYIVEGGNPQQVLLILAGAALVCVLLACVALLASRETIEDSLGFGDDDENTPIALNNDDDTPIPAASQPSTTTPLPSINDTPDPGNVEPPTGDLLFVSNRSGQWEIWVMGTDGGDPDQITRNSPGINYSPGWSPDGTQIVFEAQRNGNWDIYVMNADGSNIRNLTNNAATDRVPVWSPDGSLIAFASNRQGDNDIFIVQPDGNNLQQVTFSDADDYYPTWSPDSNHIAFQSSRAGVTNIFRQPITSTDADAVAVTTGAVPKGAPNWSPDGQFIAYYTNVGVGQGQDIFMVSAAGGEPIALATASSNEVIPTWSPDGSSIYYHQGIFGGTNIMRIDVSSRNVTPITQRSDRNWSPDIKPTGGTGIIISVPEIVPQPTTPPNVTPPVVPITTVSCPDTLPGQLNIGDRTVAVDGTQPRLYSEASTGSREIGDTVAGMVLTVLNGPRCGSGSDGDVGVAGGTGEIGTGGNGATWWYVQYGITFGWIRETAGNERQLRSAEPDLAGFAPPTNRSIPPAGSTLLEGGFGFTDGSAMPPGEFQVEWYCNILGYGVSTDGTNWLCTINGVVLAQLNVTDLDRICQATYSNARAFAVQDGSGTQPAFRWRCYGG